MNQPIVIFPRIRRSLSARKWYQAVRRKLERFMIWALSKKRIEWRSGEWRQKETNFFPLFRSPLYSHDVDKSQTNNLSILQSFYFHDILQHLNTFI